jgi:DNA polymerase
VGNQIDPRRELAALSGALAAAARRAERRGRRRDARAPAGASELPDVAGAHFALASADGAATRVAPEERARPSARPADGPAPRAAEREPARTPEDVARQAAACADLAELRASVARCQACGLAATRTQTVFADGAGDSGVMFVGEAPGADEDAQGVPFVGRAGRLLSDIITKGMGIARERTYIANVLKCRPPENRDPTSEEKRTCTPWLDRQVELVDPKVLVPLGRHAAMHVLASEMPMGRMRGRVHERGGRKVVPTYHPAYLLRSPGQKKECWQDIQLAMRELGLPGPRDGGA